MPAEWREKPLPEAARDLIEAGIGERLARLLAQRGVSTAAEARRYLSPGIADLHSPASLAGMESALELLLAARHEGSRVVVVGDYDVDGITATAILVASFQALGMTCEAILPSRRAGGYGLQPAHVERAVAAGAKLLVTADCGMQAHEALAQAALRGLQVIVTDHHLPGDVAPAAAAVINPRQAGCAYPFRELCGAGLALKLAGALFEAAKLEAPWESLLRLACLGTIADSVPLRDENRAIARLGLAALAGTRSPGLRALFAEARVGRPIGASDVAFRIGPRLNAPGRVGDPDVALELLLTRDPARGRELARELEAANQTRQGLERRVLEDCAEALANAAPAPAFVAWSAEWNKGVVGIAAGRLARDLGRPVLLFACDAEGIATGSGRSVEGLDLHGELAAAAALCVRFGGHAQAIGMTIAADRLPEFRERCLETLARPGSASATPSPIAFDQRLATRDVSLETALEVELLEPFGVGAREPVFLLGPLGLRSAPRRFGNGHLGLVASDSAGGDCEIVAWKWGSRDGPWSAPFEILAALEVDRRTSSTKARLRLIDARPALAPPNRMRGS